MAVKAHASTARERCVLKVDPFKCCHDWQVKEEEDVCQPLELSTPIIYIYIYIYIGYISKAISPAQKMAAQH